MTTVDVDITHEILVEARALLKAALQKDKDNLVILEISIGDLDSVKSYLAPFSARSRAKAITSLRSTLRQQVPQSFPSEGRDLPWKSVFFFEETTSNETIFRIYGVLRRPGILDALIAGANAKIERSMRHVDINMVQTVRYTPMAICTMYTSKVAQEVFLRHVRQAVKAASSLGAIAVDTPTKIGALNFNCHRTGR